MAVATPLLYPNPVNGPGPAFIQVGFGSNEAWVEMKVFTTGFRKVKDKTLENVAAGINNLPLDLNDDWGKPLANGLYYVVLTTPENKYVLKLLVLR